MQRQLATDFLLSNFFRASVQASQDAELAMAATGPAKDLNTDPTMQIIMAGQREPQRQTPEQVAADIETLERMLRTGKKYRGNLSQDEARAIDNQLLSMRMSAYMTYWRKRGANEFIFGGTSSTEDLLDHAIWLHLADRLGIELVEADVRKVISYDAGRDILTRNFANDERVKTFLKDRKNQQRDYKPADLLRAVTNEYRAAMAQEAFLGRGQGLRNYLTPITGYEVPVGSIALEEFAAKFRSLQTKVNVALLPVPTKKFEVTGEPTEKELQDLFTRYRKVLAQPDSNAPGLKVPRKLQVQYVTFPTELPAFKQLGQARLLAQTQLLRRVLSNVAPCPVGGGVAPVVTANMAPLFDGMDPILSVYLPFVGRNYFNWLTTSADERGGSFSLEDWSTLDGLTGNPRQVCGLVGVAASGNLLTPLLVADVTVTTGTRDDLEVRKAQILEIAKLVVPADPRYFPLEPFLNLDNSKDRKAAPPIQVLGLYLWSEALKRAQADAFAEEALAFGDQLQNLSISRDDAQRFLDRVNEGKPVKVDGQVVGATELKAGDPLLKEDPTLKVGDKVYNFHLKGALHSMKAPADKARFNDKKANPEMAGLLTAYEEGKPKPANPDEARSPLTTLGDQIFRSNTAFYALGWAPKETGLMALYSPEGMRGDGRMRAFQISRIAETTTKAKELYVFWYADSKPETEPKTLDEVRPEAIQAWRILRARTLAREAAKKIKLQLTTPSGPDSPDVEKALHAALEKAQLAGLLGDQKPIFLQDVSEVEQRTTPGGHAVTTWEPYRIKPYYIEYPTSSLPTQLLTLHNLGDSIVVSDQPEDHFYVAVLMSRKEPDFESLKVALQEIEPRFSMGQPGTLWTSKMLGPERAAYRNDLMRQLRIEAVGADKVDENGKYILPDNARKGSGNVD